MNILKSTSTMSKSNIKLTNISNNENYIDPRVPNNAPDNKTSTDSDLMPTFVGKYTEITGQAKFGELHIEGCFNGNIEAVSVIIGKTGLLKGELTCRSLQVYGLLDGRATCSNITIMAGAVVRAEIKYDSIIVKQGASITGDLRRKIFQTPKRPRGTP